jgi:hypothetical protein
MHRLRLQEPLPERVGQLIELYRQRVLPVEGEEVSVSIRVDYNWRGGSSFLVYD